MPNLPHAKKALRSQKRKTSRNENLRDKVSRATKKTLKLIEKGEKKLAQQQLHSTYRIADKAAKRRVIHPNKASRIKSRLTKKVDNMNKNVKTAPKTS